MRSLIAAKRMPSPEALDLQCVLRARGMDDIADELLLAGAEPGIVGVKLIGVQSVDPPIQASQVPLDHPYASGKAINLGVSTIGPGSTAVADLVTAGYQYLYVLARIGNATTPATALGDINQFIKLYEDDGTTLFAGGVVADTTPIVASLSGNVALIAHRYLLAGVDKVQVSLTNNNVGALQGGTLVYYLQK